MTTPLDQAASLLNGDLRLRAHSVRAAAWVTRSALEDVLRDLVRAKGCDPGQANTRSLLGCVEVLYRRDAPEVAAQAQYAWDALSRASHQHAYMLAPSHAEVASVRDTVQKLAAYVQSAAPSPENTRPE